MTGSKTKKPKKGSRTKREPLTRERVLATAMALADQDGIEALSMRTLAAALHVEPMSLYHHVKNKDEVLDGMADLVVAEIEPPAVGGADWKGAMRARARSAHAVFLRHPWGALLVGSRVNVGPAMLRYFNATIGCLYEAGFSYTMADRAMNAIDSHVYGFTMQELSFPLEPQEYASAAKQFIHLLPVETFPYMRALAQLVIDGKHYGMQDFEFGLTLILDGLERLLDDAKHVKDVNDGSDVNDINESPRSPAPSDSRRR